MAIGALMVVPVLNVINHMSTVTPCHGRPELVGQLLKSLHAERIRVDKTIQLDFYIVDSTPAGSPDSQAIYDSCITYGAYYLRGDLSVRKKRNQGAINAINNGSTILFFIDSDCEAQEGLFLAHLKAYELSCSPWSRRPVGGATGVTEFVGHRTSAYRAVENTRFLDGFKFPLLMPEAPWAPCTNFSMRADLFGKIGGFVENWEFRLGGDDTEIGRRINNAGLAIVCCPDANVHHTTSTWNSWRAVIERIWRWGRMDILIRQAEPAKQIAWKSPQPLSTGLLLAPFTLLLGVMQFATYIFCVLLVSPIILTILKPRPRGPFLPNVQAELLEFVFQAGNLLEAILLKKPLLAFKEIVTHPMQIGTSWETRRREAWAAICTGCVWLLMISILSYVLHMDGK